MKLGLAQGVYKISVLVDLNPTGYPYRLKAVSFD